MIDPATGWFDICQIERKRADYVANYLEFHWLSRYPNPTEIVLDRGGEFKAELQAMIRDEWGVNKKLITTRNPQANGIVERVHQVLGTMVATHNIRGKQDLDEFDPIWAFQGILSACRKAINSTVHTTTRATPTQLAFGRDALLNVSFQTDWEFIRERKQARIVQNNKRENRTRRHHEYKVGDKVGIILNKHRKHGEPQNKGPYTVSKVNDNGTVQLREEAAHGGAVYQTWNIRNVFPCTA